MNIPVLCCLILSLILLNPACSFAGANNGAAAGSNGAAQAEEEQPITEETPETNPEKEEIKLPETEAVLMENMRQKSEKSALRIKVKEAEKLFEKALKSYEKGSVPKAKDNFSAAAVILSSCALEASLYYELKDEYRSIFNKLQCSLSDGSTFYCVAGKKYSILIDPEDELVKKYIKLYSEGKAKPIIKKALERSGKYRPMIIRTLKEYDLPEELVYLPIVESLYSVNDLSSAGALGLWQIMPSRARALNLKVNYWIDERKDPEKSTRAAAQYLRELYIMFDDWHLALAAYNRGEFGLGRDLKFSKATNIGEMKARNAVPRETQAYVPQFVASTVIGDNPREYGFDINYDKPLAYDKVAVGKIIDLKIAAECAGTTLETIRELNPALKAWCTPHGYPDFELKIPSGTTESFFAKLATVKELNPSSGHIKYKIVKGDYLGKIAKRFDTSVKAIREDNKITNPKALRINQVLIIRPGRKYMAK